MKLPVFVSSSAVLLLLWLGVTYVREVPYKNYPKLGLDLRKAVATGGEIEEAVPMHEPEGLRTAALGEAH